MRLAATLMSLVMFAAACGSDGSTELSGPTMGDYPESLALVDGDAATADDVVVDMGEASVPPGAGMDDDGDAPMATFDEVRGSDAGDEPGAQPEDDMDAPEGFTIDFGNDVACLAIEGLALGETTDNAGIAAAFDEIASVFPSPVLPPLQAAVMGDGSAASDLFLDPDGVVDRLRLDTQTYAECGIPLFASTIGEAGMTEGEGACFTASPLDDSAKVAVGAELNEDVFVFARVSCSG